MKQVPTLYRYQRRGVRLLEQFGGRSLLADEQGLGKAQPLGSRLLTPSGWTRMRNIRVGDSVIGGDGLPTTVTGVFPQGKKTVYRVWFSDGSKTECCDDHLWAVWTPTAKNNKYPPKVYPLSTIRKTLVTPAGYLRHVIPVVKEVQFNASPVPADPYLIGCLIGDGSIGNKASIGYTTGDIELHRSLQAVLPRGTRAVLSNTNGQALTFRITKEGEQSSLPNPMLNILRELKLQGHKSNSKFVPQIYRHNSKEVRVAVLQGLMDTDGYVSATGTVQFCTVSPRLARHVRELVWSLGGTCRQTTKLPKYTHKGELRTGQLAYILTLCLPPGIQPFRLERKTSRYTGRSKYHPTRNIVRVEKVGVKECQCIRVAAADGLYVTDNFVVTHNTNQVITWRKRQENKGFTLVVCPAGVKYHWQDEFKLWGDERAVVLNGTRPDAYHKALLSRRTGVFIINYDILGRWLPLLKTAKPWLVVFDECHALKNRSSVRYKNSLKLQKGVPHLLALSGTPFTNRPAELWAVLNMLWPEEFPSFWAFALRHCQPERKRWGWEYKGAVRLKELHRKLVSLGMVRRLKKDVLQDLPPTSRFVVPVPLGPAARKEYKEAEEDFLKYLRRVHGDKKARRAAKAAMMVKMGYLIRLVGTLKYAAVKEWIETFLEDNDGKLIVFGVHKAVVRGLYHEKKLRPLSVVVDGGVTAVQRHQEVRKFRKLPKKRLFFGNIKAAGTGWNGTAASTVLFAEFGWTPGDHAQAEARPHRIGQTEPVMVYYLVVPDTIEDHLCKVLQAKQRVSDQVLDGTKQVEGGLDVYDLVSRNMLKKGKRRP